MKSIGAILRQERLRQGLDLDQIAERTKIGANLLEAIEAGDLKRLPGTFFVRSFVRQYARALGLDESELDEELNRLSAPEPVPTPHAGQLPARPVALPRIATRAVPRFSGQRLWGSLLGLVLIVAACSAIYVLWQRSHETPPPVAAAPAPARPAAAIQERQTAAAQPSTPASVPEQPPSDTPVGEAAVPPPSGTSGTQTAPITLELRAVEPAWVRVTSDGKLLFEATLQPGEQRTFSGSHLLTLRTGNAGGLEASYNGKPIGPLGPKGLIRNGEFTPQDYKVTAPEPKPPAEPPPGQPEAKKGSDQSAPPTCRLSPERTPTGRPV